MNVKPGVEGVLPLEDAVGHGCGGKAAALAALVRAGFPVPPAIVVMPEVLDDLTAGPDGGDPALRAARISAELLPETWVATLMSAVARLGDGRLAVRSSGLDEDGAAQSFAGQHHTALDVEAAPGPLLDAVRACWVSAFATHVETYRGAVGASRGHTRMAVLIQRMVTPRCAGVAFTRDPVHGGAEVVVEAVEGLGEALVSGRRAPDRFRVSREGTLLEATVGATPSGLTPAEAQAVADLALRVEAHMGQPQDIEWAIDDRGVHLLQARPITSSTPLAEPAPDDHVRVWASSNARELFPRLATPMTASVLDVVLKGFFGSTFRMLGVDLDKVPLAGVIGGRIYMCMNTFIVFFRIIPGMGRRTPAEMFGGDAEATRRALDAIPERDPLVPRPGAFTVLVGLLRLLLTIVFMGRRAARSALDAAHADNVELLRTDVDTASEAELYTHLRRALRFGEVWTRMAHATAPGIVSFEVSHHLSTRWLGPSDTNLLFSGMGDVASAQSARDLLGLATALREAGLHTATPAPTLAQLRATEHPSTALARFIQSFDAWMVHHGHHARGEADVAIPRLQEEPEGVFRMVQELARGGDAPSGDRHQAAREALLAALPARLGTLRARLLLRWVSRGRAGITFRENTKSELIRRLSVVRRALNALGARWVEAGHLAEAGDIYFLDLGEVLAGATSTPLRPRIRARKAELRRWSGLHPPSVVVGTLTPAQCLPEPPSTATRLTGLPVSPGVVVGRARVMLEAEAGGVLSAGEILVAPFTDPGWAPHFVLAAGLVVDEGGMLSHGSVVARELGLPAVVNVREGTRAIGTGDLLRLDAFTGEVVILERAGDTTPAREHAT